MNLSLKFTLVALLLGNASAESGMCFVCDVYLCGLLFVCTSIKYESNKNLMSHISSCSQEEEEEEEPKEEVMVAKSPPASPPDFQYLGNEGTQGDIKYLGDKGTKK